MLRRVALVGTDLTLQYTASIIGVTRIGELVISAVTSNRSTITANVVPNSPIVVTLMMVPVFSSEKSVSARATRPYIPEDDILHSHRRENLKSYITLTGCAQQRRRNVFPVRYEPDFYLPEDGILHSHRSENLKSYNIRNIVILCPLYTNFSRHFARNKLTIHNSNGSACACACVCGSQDHASGSPQLITRELMEAPVFVNVSALCNLVLLQSLLGARLQLLHTFSCKL
jgi:hypothetical protein